MIARASGESVPAFDTDATDLEAWKKGDVSTVTATTDTQPAATPSAPVTTATEPAPATVPPTREPEMTPPAPVTSAPSVTASQPEPPATPVGTSGRAEALPRTASELPLVGLIGVVALAGAFAMRALRRA
jgi:hypothetical protein